MKKIDFKTLLKQLGGNGFIAMTGAKNFIKIAEDTISFRLPINFAKNKSNLIKITLNEKDTYNIDFIRVRGLKFSSIKKEKDVFCDKVQEIFNYNTGLETKI